VYDHAWFCIYVYFGVYLPSTRKNICIFCFWPWLTLLSMSSSFIHLPLTFKLHNSLWLSNTPLCIYTTISWSSHQL
jgi:hypothetical protein